VRAQDKTRAERWKSKHYNKTVRSLRKPGRSEEERQAINRLANTKLTNCAVSFIRSDQKGVIMADAKNKQEKTQRTGTQEHKSEQQLAQHAGVQSGEQTQTGLSRREQGAGPMIWASPFTLLRRFGEDMDRLFEELAVRRGLMPRGSNEIAVWSPQVEVMERDGQLVIRADLPGLNKDDVKIELRDDAVIIRGERQQEHEEQREGYYRSERSYGSFYRQVPLPKGVNTENATATFRDGVLEITMQAPKREPSSRLLEIQDAQAAGQPLAKAQAAGASR
jgi:HSP20 family protein